MESREKISIVLADDHTVVREGLRLLLGSVEDFILAGESGDGIETLRLVERVRPRVLVLDVSMPALGGLEVVREITTRRLPTRVLMLTMYAGEKYVRDAFRLGATGYLAKGCSSAELVEAIRTVASGSRFVGQSISSAKIFPDLSSLPGAGPLDPYEGLTTREREVLQLVAEGHTNVQIGKRLFISPRTVETHRAKVMRKLSLRNHAELVRYAMGRGLLSE